MSFLVIPNLKKFGGKVEKIGLVSFNWSVLGIKCWFQMRFILDVKFLVNKSM